MTKDITTVNGNGVLATGRYEISDKWTSRAGHLRRETKRSREPTTYLTKLRKRGTKSLSRHRWSLLARLWLLEPATKQRIVII